MDIGPGDAVIALHTCTPTLGCRDTREGSVYFVRSLDNAGNEPCCLCGEVKPGFHLQGDMPNPFAMWCPCGFRPYHGPEVEREAFHAKDRGKIGRFELYRLSTISGIQPK